MRKNVTTGLMVLVVVLASACGDEGAVPSEPDTASTTSPGSRGVSLTIDAGSLELPDARSASVRTVSGAVEVVGYLDDPDAVASGLANAAIVARLVDGPATDVACTEQYGGPDVAHVVGTIDGRLVDTRFHRADGCGIADWDLAQPILPPPIWSGAPDALVGDGAHPVVLAPGERFTIRLQANATTGYEWEIIVPAGLAVVDDRYEQSDDTGLVGAGGVQVFVIEAGQAGGSVIELAYRQPFEEGTEPAETRTINVEVVAAD